MKFADWIDSRGLLRAEIARRLGVSQGHVTDLCNNRFWPTRAMAQRIWRLTGGEVTPNDYLFEDESESG